MTQLQFEELIQQHGDNIYGFCCHLTGKATRQRTYTTIRC